MEAWQVSQLNSVPQRLSHSFGFRPINDVIVTKLIGLFYIHVYAAKVKVIVA
jgi:hypothetical protein